MLIDRLTGELSLFTHAYIKFILPEKIDDDESDVGVVRGVPDGEPGGTRCS